MPSHRKPATRTWRARTLAIGATVALLATAGPATFSASAAPAEPCDTSTATSVVTPKGPGQYRPSSSAFTRQTVMDARAASWTRESAGDYPVLFKDQKYPAGGSVCFLGGSITSSENMAASWDDVWHHTVSLYTDHPYTTVRGLRVDNAGDCIGIKDPGDASLTRIQGVALTNCHDDAIENDLMKSVEVTDSLLEGYVIWAGRGGSAGAEDGRNNTYKIDRVIAWLKPQQAVYKGSRPGTGPIFKRPNADGSQGYEPNYTITNTIIRVDQKPNHGDLSIPPGPHSNNVIVWTGAGAYPGPVPLGFRVTTDVGVWEKARADWLAVPQAERSAPGTYRSPTPPTTPPATPTTTTPMPPTTTAPDPCGTE